VSAVTSRRVGLPGLCAIAALVAGCPREPAPAPDVNTASSPGDSTSSLAAARVVVKRTATIVQNAHIVNYDISAAISPDDHTISTTAIVRWLAPADVSSVS